ncbi:MAG: PRC-barrel domain-containing protein [Candidatus Limnocylindrales bacterium]
MSENQPVSWRSIVYGTPVMSSDHEPVGHVHEVLGDDADDIFHGLRVGLAGGHRDVLVSVDDVASMSADAVRVDLTRSALEALPTYDEEATYHLASVGWLRKHIGWQKDSDSNEEPG